MELILIVGVVLAWISSSTHVSYPRPLQLQLKSPSSLQGKLRTRTELDQYEEVWHSRIFTPHWNSLKETVSHSYWCSNINTRELVFLDLMICIR